jgi:hypothetical protein
VLRHIGDGAGQLGDAIGEADVDGVMMENFTRPQPSGNRIRDGLVAREGGGRSGGRWSCGDRLPGPS